MKTLLASCLIACSALAEQKPDSADEYNRKASELLVQARETSDRKYCAQASSYVEKSLALSKDNFEAEQLRASILLCQHDYVAALEAARILNKRMPDDVMSYGLLVDANTALGNYKDAEEAGQWMLNLRPGNLPALIHAAHLRELFGDAEGASELMNIGYQSTSSADQSQRASILAYMGHLNLAAGKTDVAEKAVQKALTALPGYPEALGNLAEVRIAQKRYDDAVSLRRQVYRATQTSGALCDLAEALELAGHPDEAGKAFTDFEAKASAESHDKDNSNRKLILYYADRAKQPEKALALAKQEYAWRRDVFTLDAYAWALHVSGDDAEARVQVQAALAVGIRTPEMIYHAAQIK